MINSPALQKCLEEGHDFAEFTETKNTSSALGRFRSEKVSVFCRRCGLDQHLAAMGTTRYEAMAEDRSALAEALEENKRLRALLAPYAFSQSLEQNEWEKIEQEAQEILR